MTVARLLSTGQNAEPPDAETSRGLRLINCRDGAVENGKPSLVPFSAHLIGRSKRGVPCPIQTFVADRQRMLRSWLALQGAAPAHILADELIATISALRQLMEVSCDDEGKR